MGSAAASPPPSGKLTQEELKRVAAHRAVEFVEPGMTLGLGTGSTAAHALDRLGDLLRAGALPGFREDPIRSNSIHLHAMEIDYGFCDRLIALFRVDFSGRGELSIR
ncbi:putative ribose-5-phosphate isomerase 2 [Zea mays]|uniref:Putative ribose-5-phosphate isomerase 2 n=1 Tax=Zea mays TaxID=4577 RepID=A0A1D6QHH3_MAIZE|nr:putative ribose-5-phosphate isomerase 2 [Zea mays]